MKYKLTFLLMTTFMAGHTQEDTHGFIHVEDRTKNIAPVYHQAGNFSSGLAPVERDGKWGFIDANGREVIAPRYDYARDFRHGQSIVKVGEFYGIINQKGEFAVPPTYYDLMRYEWQGTPYYVSRDSTFFQGIIDTAGREVIPHRYTYVITMESNIGQRKLYRNIPFYTTYRDIDTTKGSFYVQFGENAFGFAPEKGRQDYYDAGFNSVASREVSSYTDEFNGMELARIDAYLEEHQTTDLNEKRAAIRRLLAELDTVGAGPETTSPAVSSVADADRSFYQTVRRDTVAGRTVLRYGLADRRGGDILPPDYNRIRSLDDSLLLTKRDRETARGAEELIGLYRTSGEAVIPEGVFSAIEPVAGRPDLFVAEWADRYPTKAEQKAREAANKHFVLLRTEGDTYTVVQQFAASRVYTGWLDPETGLMKYRKRTEESVKQGSHN